MRTIIAAALLAWCCNAMAGDLPDLGEPAPLGRYELTKGQIAAETGYMALLYVDYRQTMDIRGWCGRNAGWNDSGNPNVTYHEDGLVTAENGAWCHRYETNPLLGRHPSDVRIRNYFALSAVTHLAVAKALPSEYRPYWQGAGIIWQLAYVIRNRRIGLSTNF